MNANQSETILFLQNKALALRIDSIRATTTSKSGHPTSCLSAADLVAALFFNIMKFDPQDHYHPNNDRFILSKGHAIPVIYAAWKHLVVLSDEQLMALRTFDSPLEGHPTPRFIHNEAATGSLGQGLSIGVGMALHAKKTNHNYTTYVMIGDGESSEGSIWEAAEFASHYHLDNLIGLTDCNRLGQAGPSLDAHNIDVMAKKWQAFGWKTFVIDGHNMPEIIDALKQAQEIKNRPVMVLAKTYKSYGLDDMQDTHGYHGRPFPPEELEKRLAQLKEKFAKAATYQPASFTPPPPPKAPKQQKTLIPSIDLASDPNTKLFNKDSQLATRKAFGYGLAALARKVPNVFGLDGDVKNSTFTMFLEKEDPERLIQCFIAEQNMLGVASGMQLRGAIPFTATFGAFFTRACDQIRMAGIGRNALRLCGSHCGVSIGQDGPSQMGLEDLALMRVIPNSIVLYPSDAVCAFKLVECMARYNDGISYMRTTRSDTPILYDKNEEFTIGGCKVLKKSDNDKACIIAAGITLHEALKAHKELANQEIAVSVIDLYSIKPFDIQTVRATAKNSANTIITVEDHYPQGGIGEAISHAFINEDFRIETLAVKGISRSGTPQELLQFAGISAEQIIEKVKTCI
jgi:transketolase